MFCKGFIYVPHSVADLDPSFQIKSQHLKKCSNRLIFLTFWPVIHKLMRFRIQLISYQSDADPDPTFQFDADPDSQYWFHLALVDTMYSTGTLQVQEAT